MTAKAGLGAILDKEYFEKNIQKIKENRAFTISELEKLGFIHTNSTANFIFVKSNKISGKDLYIKLKENGILVRHFDKERINDFIRVTIGSKEEMQEFIKIVKQILEEIKWEVLK